MLALSDGAVWNWVGVMGDCPVVVLGLLEIFFQLHFSICVRCTFLETEA